MKLRIFSIFSLSCALTAFSQGQDVDHNYAPVEVGNTTLSLQHRWSRFDWINETKFDSQNTFFFGSTRQPDQFFVWDGQLFVNKVTEDGKHEFLIADGSTGEPLKGVNLDLSAYDNSVAATFFSGNDSYGTPYVASCAIFGNSSYPMTIHTVEVGYDGSLKAGLRYELPVKTGLSGFTQSPGIYGNLNDGEFVVACPVWPEYSLSESGAASTKLAIWEVSGNDVDFHLYDLQLSVCDVLPLGNKLVLIHDSDVFPSASTPAYPTLYRYGEKNLVPVGRLDSQALFNDTYGNGVAVIGSTDGTPVVIYASGGAPATYSAVAVPGLAEGFGSARPLWHFAGGESFADGVQDRMYNRTTIGKEMLDDNNCRIYMLSHHKSLASYAVTSEDKTTGVDTVFAEDSPTEYHTLTGIRVESPSAPGVYIVRKGSSTYKTIIK